MQNDEMYEVPCSISRLVAHVQLKVGHGTRYALGYEWLSLAYYL